MRTAGRDHRLVRTAARAIVLGSIWLTLASVALGASPAPSDMLGGDPRSSGQGPGLVGDPMFALGAVLVIGLGALILTLGYVKLTSRRDI
ncbi:MAG: hypothetical protein ACXWWR_05885 [Candidatus Limnocylindrales bacterium]